ncbi:uncharacterized protein LOC126745438 [Anthonomus grandis grandis]|uniref:uncharacterized protein LOC126745438 n=1 Tax=Anthonomus grandis grandis TaxID=2921223 RepID=UPI0021667D35|nr:uncharacterized protein LOC126745438 [Anthonomus grandis grandis]
MQITLNLWQSPMAGQQKLKNPQYFPTKSPRRRYGEENVRRLFYSASFVDSNNVSKRIVEVEGLRNSSTQTSKTLVSLNLPLEPDLSPRLSPDSLSPNTGRLINDNELDDLPQPMAEQPHIIDKELTFVRKNCVLRYLQRSKHEQGDNEDKLPADSLTKLFLCKAKSKKAPDIIRNSSPRVTRSNFLQQTSPLRNIMPDIQENQFKSYSYAAMHSPKDTLQTIKHTKPRFKVQRIGEKVQAPSAVKPVKYFCEKELTLNLSSSKSSPKSIVKTHSFMSPTFSSEQKNKMREIETLSCLISPTRRGRSASPKPQLNLNQHVARKVPYIDKSSTSTLQGPMTDLNLCSSKLNMSNSTISESGKYEPKPELELVQSINKMKNLDWNVSLRGLAEIVEICRTTEADIVYPHMTVINQRVIEMLKSPRSHVCRTTCKAVGHLFEYLKDTRRPEFDEIVDTLLYKTADSNKFIRQDANLALDCMVTHIPALNAVRSLCAKGPDHKNHLVRIATARLVVCAVVIAGTNTVLNPNAGDFTRKRVILNMVKFLSDKHLEVRKYGQRLYYLLNSDSMFEFFLRRYVEKDTITKMKTCFKSYHPKENNR